MFEVNVKNVMEGRRTNRRYISWISVSCSCTWPEVFPVTSQPRCRLPSFHSWLKNMNVVREVKKIKNTYNVKNMSKNWKRMIKQW